MEKYCFILDILYYIKSILDTYFSNSPNGVAVDLNLPQSSPHTCVTEETPLQNFLEVEWMNEWPFIPIPIMWTCNNNNNNQGSEIFSSEFQGNHGGLLFVYWQIMISNHTYMIA